MFIMIKVSLEVRIELTYIILCHSTSLQISIQISSSLFIGKFLPHKNIPSPFPPKIPLNSNHHKHTTSGVSLPIVVDKVEVSFNQDSTSKKDIEINNNRMNIFGKYKDSIYFDIKQLKVFISHNLSPFSLPPYHMFIPFMRGSTNYTYLTWFQLYGAFLLIG